MMSIVYANLNNEKMREMVYANAKSISADPLKNMFATLGDFRKWSRQWVMVSCWHMNDEESAAMWKLYTRTDEAICIQSTYHSLRECLDQEIYVGEMQYIDYAKEWMPEDNIFYPFMHKRKSFEHERELRALFCRLPTTQTGIDMKAVPNGPGVWQKADFDRLIEKIYVAPSCPVWLRELLQKVVDRYDLKRQVQCSSLDEDPFF